MNFPSFDEDISKQGGAVNTQTNIANSNQLQSLI